MMVLFDVASLFRCWRSSKEEEASNPVSVCMHMSENERLQRLYGL